MKAVFVCSGGDMQYQKWACMTLSTFDQHTSDKSIDLLWFYADEEDLPALRALPVPSRTQFILLPTDPEFHYFQMLPYAIKQLTKYDRVLALDIDTVTTGDMSTLFDLPLNGKVAAVKPVWDSSDGAPFTSRWEYEHWKYIATEEKTDTSLMILLLSQLEVCFNSGVMLIDPVAYDNIVTDDFIEWCETYNNNVWYFDQEFLNVQLNGEVTLLPHNVNIQPMLDSHDTDFDLPNRQIEYHETSNNGITHYVGHAKRWWTESYIPLHDIVKLLKNDSIGSTNKAYHMSRSGITTYIKPLLEWHDRIGILSVSKSELADLKWIATWQEKHLEYNV